MKLKQADADTAEALPDEIKKGYERTVAKSIKMMEVYPKRRRWHDDATYLKARASYYMREYSAAVRRFRQFQKEYPQSPFVPASYLYLGKAYLGDGNLQKAEETFLLIMEKYPQLNNDEEVTLLLAEVAIQREGKSQAVMILEQSLKSIKSEVKRMDILLRLCALYIDLQLYDKAITLLKNAPRNKDFQNALFKMDYYLLICYKNKQDFEKALALADEMYRNKQYLKHTSKILFEKATVLIVTRRIKEAVTVLDLVTGTDGEPAVQAQAWFELGKIHQHEYGDYKKARECYEKIQPLTSDEKLLAAARERMDGIDFRLQYLSETASKKSQKDTSDTAYSIYASHYKMAEIFWLNLDEADSALKYYTIITSDTAADSALLPKALYARAWIVRFIKKDTAVSDSLYKMVISRYPATIVAKKSQQDLGAEVTVKTRADSATLAIIEAERLLFDVKNPVAAVNAYYKLSKEYSDIEGIAANCLYAAAWICDDVLNKNKKAFVLYKKLCEDFPESDLCKNEAKPRIQFVEDTLKVLEARKKQDAAMKQQQKGAIKKEKKAKKEETLSPDTTADTGEDFLQPDQDVSPKQETPKPELPDSVSSQLQGPDMKKE